MASSSAEANTQEEDDIRELLHMYDGLNHIIFAELAKSDGCTKDVAKSVNFLKSLAEPLEPLIAEHLTVEQELRSKIAELSMYIMEGLDLSKCREMEKMLVAIGKSAACGAESFDAIRTLFRVQGILQSVEEEIKWVFPGPFTNPNTDGEIEGISKKWKGKQMVKVLKGKDEEAIMTVTLDFPFDHLQQQMISFLKPIARSLSEANLLVRPDYLRALSSASAPLAQPTIVDDPCLRRCYSKTAIEKTVIQDLGKDVWQKISKESRRSHAVDTDAEEEHEDEQEEDEEDEEDEQEDDDEQDEEVQETPPKKKLSQKQKQKQKQKHPQNLTRKQKQKQPQQHHHHQLSPSASRSPSRAASSPPVSPDKEEESPPAQKRKARAVSDESKENDPTVTKRSKRTNTTNTQPESSTAALGRGMTTSATALAARINDPLQHALHLAKDLDPNDTTSETTPKKKHHTAQTQTPSASNQSTPRARGQASTPKSNGKAKPTAKSKSGSGSHNILGGELSAKQPTWDDTDADSVASDIPSPKSQYSKRSRVRSRSPSPLKKSEFRSPAKVGITKRRKWAPLEEQMLELGVKRHGVGKWAAILSDKEFRSILQHRTSVNLKDKWRNLERLPLFSACLDK